MPDRGVFDWGDEVGVSQEDLGLFRATRSLADMRSNKFPLGI